MWKLRKSVRNDRCTIEKIKAPASELTPVGEHHAVFLVWSGCYIGLYRERPVGEDRRDIRRQAYPLAPIDIFGPGLRIGRSHACKAVITSTLPLPRRTERASPSTSTDNDQRDSGSYPANPQERPAIDPAPFRARWRRSWRTPGNGAGELARWKTPNAAWCSDRAAAGAPAASDSLDISDPCPTTSVYLVERHLLSGR